MGEEGLPLGAAEFDEYVQHTEFVLQCDASWLLPERFVALARRRLLQLHDAKLTSAESRELAWLATLRGGVLLRDLTRAVNKWRPATPALLNVRRTPFDDAPSGAAAAALGPRSVTDEDVWAALGGTKGARRLLRVARAWAERSRVLGRHECLVALHGRRVPKTVWRRIERHLLHFGLRPPGSVPTWRALTVLLVDTRPTAVDDAHWPPGAAGSGPVVLHVYAREGRHGALRVSALDALLFELALIAHGASTYAVPAAILDELYPVSSIPPAATVSSAASLA